MRQNSKRIWALVLMLVSFVALSACEMLSCAHEWSEWEVTKEATCNEAGLKEQTCSKCGTTTEEVINPLGHDYGAWIQEVASSCTTAGSVGHYQCANCEKYFDENYQEISNIEISAGHQYKLDAWGYKDAEGHAHLCVNCDGHDQIVGHTSSGEATENEAEVCTECGYIIKAALGHITHTPKDEWESDDVNHWHNCTGCDDVQLSKEEHTYDNACDATCNVCGDVREVGAHEGEYACSEVCKHCGAAIEGLAHTYDNACDTTCNVCGDVREVGAHEGEHACSEECKHCGAAIEGLAHTYDNACDTTCNVCGDVREVGAHEGEHACSEECKHCGVDVTPTAAHTGGAATCSAKAVCEVCGTKYGELNAENHSEELTHEVVGTCEVYASKTYTCKWCDAVRVETADVLADHSWVIGETVAATCQKGGYTVRECSVCHTKENYNQTAIIDCVEEYEVTLTATCVAEGEGTYTCTMCNATRTVKLEKLPHQYSETVIAATCETAGYTLHTCECGDSYKDNEVSSFGGHDFVTVEGESYEPTCTETGLTYQECSRCDATNEVVISAIGHNPVAPTCTEEGYCANCGGEKVAKLGHNYVVVSEQLPTCTVDGYLVSECSRCDATKNETTDAYKALGHNEAEIVWTEVEESVGVCTYVTVRSGKCPTCDEEVSYTGDDYVSHKYTCTITKPATCSLEGIKTYTCTCGVSYEEAYDEADAHAWDEGVTEAGITTYTCLHNAEHIKTAVSAKSEENATINSDALKNSEEVELKDATLILDDNTKNQVGDSDVSLSAGVLAGEDLDNALAMLDDDQKALLGDSNIFNFTMEVDGNLISEFAGKIKVRVPYTLAEGEDPEDIVIWYISEEEPTLIEAKYIVIDGVGYAEFETDHFSYYTVTKLTPRQRCDIYGHNTKNSVTVIPATCLSNGYTLTICRRCGEKTISNEVSALGHNWVLDEATYTVVSCTDDGYEKYSCSNCQISYEVITDAFGHDWVLDEEKSTSATCTSVGENIYHCHICSGNYIETLAKLPHNLDAVVTEPTCTVIGYTTYTCKDCDYVVIDDYVEATGHDVVDEIHKPNCMEKGYTAHYCRNCKEVFANTDETEKGDHEWDRDEPDCEHDRKCIHCHTRHEHGKAHGHSMKHGRCEYCNKECEHDFEYSHDVPSSCSVKGHKVYRCKHCYETEAREELDTLQHKYRVFKEAEATCKHPAYRIEVCKDCGHQNKIEFGEKAEHEFRNGRCVHCGIGSDLIYINMLKGFKDFKGLSLKLENLSYYFEETVYLDGSGALSWELVGGITQIDVIELMLYLDENGELQGGATGSISILNGPVEGETVYSAQAFIYEGDIYIIIESDYDEVDDMNIVVSTDWVLQSIFHEGLDLDIDFDIFESEEFDRILTGVEKVVDSKAQEINGFIEKVVNIIFEVESTKDGYLYTLSYDKLRDLNDNLAQLTVKELVNYYFGEKAFDDVVAFVKELADVKLGEVDTYLNETLGLPYDELVALVNEICYMAGAPSDFDIDLVLHSEEYANYSLGFLVTQGKEDYQSMIDELVGYLEKYRLYDIIGVNASDITNTITSVINELEKTIKVSFETDNTGKVINYGITFDEFSIQSSSDERHFVSFVLSIIPNGTIDITWQDIVNTIKDYVSVLDKEDEIIYDSEHVYQEMSGMEYNGVFYQAMMQNFEFSRRVHYYSNPVGQMVYPSCGDWVNIEIIYEYAREYARCQLVALIGEEGSPVYYLMIDQYAGITIELTLDEEAGMIHFTRPDGTTGSIPNDEGEYVDIFTNVFGQLCWKVDYISTRSYSIYYNPVTDEYQDENPHHYVFDELNSYEPENCGIDGYEQYVCENCGDSYGYYYNNFEHKHVLDEEKSYEPESCNIPGYNYYVCIECGDSYGYSYNNISHQYVIDEANSYYPENCEEEGYIAYICTSCGSGHKNYYWKSHEYHSEYRLHEGATSCEEGVDRYEVCKHCGDVAWTEEYYSYDHVINGVMVYDGEYVIYQDECLCCGLATSNPTTFFKVDSEEVISYYKTQDNRAYFAFVPQTSGYYEFYATAWNDHRDTWGAIYDMNMREIISNDDYYDMQFAMRTYLEAGQTYYLCAGLLSNSFEKESFIMHFCQQVVETIDLTQFGSVCGGNLVIVSDFHQKRVALELNCNMVWNDEYGCECCETCGFAFREYSGYYTDEICREVYQHVLYFANINTEIQYEYVVDEYFTGQINHNTYETSDYNEEIIVDENGNEILVVTETFTHYCNNCNNPIEKHVYEYHYNDDTRIFVAISHYNYNFDIADFVLYQTEERHQDYYEVNGYQRSYESLIKHTYYDELGNVRHWEQIEYIRTSGSCQVTRIESYANGEGSTSTYYDHSVSEKEVAEESGEETFVGEDGKTYVRYTETTEHYCTICYASINKYRNINVFDENGYQVSYEYIEFVAYANSADDYGYYMTRSEKETNGIYEYAEGQIASYPLSRENKYYNNGELVEEQQTIYEYPYGNYCVALVSHYYNGMLEYSEEETNHIKRVYIYRLHEGSETCRDGIDRWRVCLCCNYEELRSEYYTYDHWINDSLVETVDMTPYGAVCGGYINIKTCACGQNKNVETNFGCDFEYSSNWSDSEQYREHYTEIYGCAVTHPNLCGFEYSREHWYSTDEFCRETRYYRYVFGLNTANPYILEWSYLTGSTSHQYAWTETVENTYEEDGFTVKTYTQDQVCVKCGYRNETLIRYEYFDSNFEMVKHAEEHIYYSNGLINMSDYYLYEKVIFEEVDYNDFLQTYSKHAYYDEGAISSYREHYYEFGLVRSADGNRWEVRVFQEREEQYQGDQLYYWSERICDYSICIYAPIVTFTDSNGEYSENHENHYSWNYGHQYWIAEPTCTQSGIAYLECSWCKDSKEEYRSPYDHNYYHNGEMYVCSRCGLENFTGHDGTIAMEDLTAKLGNHENYVIGYYFYGNYFEYIVTVSLVVEGLDEPIILDTWAEDDGQSLIYVNIEEVKAEIEALGYSICHEMVRVNIVPLNGDTDFEYAVTLDPHVFENGEAVLSDMCGGYITYEKCLYCDTFSDDFEHSLNCEYRYNCNEYTDENGCFHSVETYSCVNCSLVYVFERYEVYEENCTTSVYYNYYFDLNADGTYEYELQELSERRDEHRYAYNYFDNGDGSITRLRYCSSCGLEAGYIHNLATVVSNYELILDTTNTNYWVMLEFNVTESGTYTFYSSNNDGDIYGAIMSNEGSILVENDDAAGNLNFSVSMYLEAGQTYYLASRFLSTDRNYGCYTLNLELVA